MQKVANVNICYLFSRIKMKKAFFAILLCFVFVLLYGCKKKETIVYSGVVTVYAATTFEDINDIKNDFEATYPGIVFDYYNSDVYDLKNTLTDELLSDEITVDVVYVENGLDEKFFDIDELVLPDTRKIKKNNKFIGKLAVVKESLNKENGKLLVDYLLSKES